MSGRDYVGRVGALAVALGVGGLIVALPGLASADTERDGDTGSDAAKAAKPAAGPARAGDSTRRVADRVAERPARSAPVRAAAAAPKASIAVAPDVKGPSSLHTADPSAPVTEPLAWATLAVTRRQPTPAAAVPAPTPAPAAGYDAVTERISTAGEQAWADAQSSYASFESFFTGIPARQVQQWLLDTQSDALVDASEQVIAAQGRDLRPIANTLAPIMAAGVRNWITNGTVGAQIDQIATDPTVLAFVAGWAGDGVAGLGLPPAVSAAVGSAAAGLLQNVFGGPANAAVRAAADAYLRTLPGGPEGWDDTELLYALWQGDLGFGELIDDQIGTQALIGIPSFLADSAVQQALGAATGDAIAQLAADRAVAAYVGQLIASSVAGQLGSGPATALGDAVAGLIPVMSDGLGAVTATALTSFLSQPGVSGALSSATSALITAAWDDDVSEALSDLLPTLLTDPGLRAGIGAAVTDALGTVDTALLGDPAVTAALGDAVTTLVTRLASDPVAWSQLTAQLSGLTGGSGIGTTIAGLLADPSLVIGLAPVAGDAIAAFLDAPGVSTALTGTAAQLVTALLAGANTSAALRDSWETLQDDASIQAAFAATVSTLVQALGDPDVGGDVITTLVAQLTNSPAARDAITEQLGALLGDQVAELLAPLGDGLAEVIAPALDQLLNAPGVGPVLTGVVAQVLAGADPADALQTVLTTVAGDPDLQQALGAAITGSVNTVLANADIRNALGDAAGAAVGDALAGSGFAAVASQVTGVAVTALLGNPAVGSVIGDVAGAILGGLPTEELATTVIQTVLSNGGLQAAVGFAIGQGIGSLLGDNVFGAIVGQLAGVATTLVIGFVAPLALMAIPAPAAATRNSGSPAVPTWWLPAVVA